MPPSPNVTPLFEKLAADARFRELVAQGLRGHTIHRDHFPHYSESTCRRAADHVRRGGVGAAAESVPPSPDALTDRHEIAGNDWHITLPRTRIKTLEELLDYCEVDRTLWDVERFVVNKWEMGAAKDGEITVEPLFQVKATLRRRVEIQRARETLQELIAAAKEWAPVYPGVERKARRRSGLLLEVSIYDLHMAKLAWAPETGASYDTRIAETLFFDALNHLLDQARKFDVSGILFPIGNDLLHVDSNANTTTGGTPQDVDGRYHRTFRTTRQMLVQGIDLAREVADVDVLTVPGNHDEQSTLAIGDALECWYHRDSHVSVDNAPRLRKYREFGNTLLQFTHGKHEKPDTLAQIAAAEEPERWGRTRHREAHVGHWHTAALKEYHGFRVRWIPSLAAADSWHARKGFVGNERQAEAYLWDPQDGLSAHLIYTAPGEN